MSRGQQRRSLLKGIAQFYSALKDLRVSFPKVRNVKRSCQIDTNRCANFWQLFAQWSARSNMPQLCKWCFLPKYGTTGILKELTAESLGRREKFCQSLCLHSVYRFSTLQLGEKRVKFFKMRSTFCFPVFPPCDFSFLPQFLFSAFRPSRIVHFRSCYESTSFL